MQKSEYPFILKFRDQFGCEQQIRVSQPEIDSLRAFGAVRRNPMRFKQYNLIGTGSEFYRENGLLRVKEFHAAPPTNPPLAADANTRLRREGLVQEAHWLAMRCNAAEILHKAPCKSGNYQMQSDFAVQCLSS